jgi:1,4-dihydroxy-2-naphthoyl-CoA hydrolase
MDIAHLQALIEPLLPGTLGIRIDEVGADRVLGSMTVRPDLCTAGCILHGGAYMAFADTLGAVATVINLLPNTRTTTIESKTNFLASAPQGSRVVGETLPLHKGRNTMVWQTQIRREDGRLCAVVTQTQMVLPA